MARHPRDIDEATLRVLLAPGIGPATLRRLRDRFGSDRNVVAASAGALEEVRGIGPETAAALRRALAAADPDAERAAMERTGVRLVLRGDGDYPALLAAIPGPPEALWVRGELDARDRFAVAIVGARRATPYGLEQAARFAALLAQSGLAVVSGGAAGIDAAAHRGALRVDGRTIAVMGCGLARSYPRQHARLFDRIVDAGGALVSEHPVETPPRAANFPRRNRIVSGLSLGVLVIEAARRSGASITARLAAEEHGREVMALPGRVDSPASAGCHQLIQDGGAALVTSHADVVRQLEASGQPVRDLLNSARPGDGSGDDGRGDGGAAGAGGAGGSPAGGPTLLDLALTPGQAAIVGVLRDAAGSMPVETIAARIERPMSEVLAEVTLLEIRGRIFRDHRGLRIRAGREPPAAPRENPGEPGSPA